MGCGSSGHVIAPAEDGHKMANGNDKMTNGNDKKASCNEANDTNKANEANETNRANGANSHHHTDDLPTVVLPDTPAKPRPPIAFEIPIEEFDVNPKATTPPPHLQRLLHPPPADIKLPDIREKLAEAEQRRLLILQQRAASAQKRAQRMTKSSKINDDFLGPEESKHGPNVVTISPEPGVCEDKNI
ncbi:uncharacterized protein LOC112050903 isoform X1 [Bicyclus anynana]|uniref:Uncharacterized protein LOC112050903 isoform X1 n=1 Tax=Bicyclus anynana TaxID=110368 RepID=A0A6J1NJG7_BICAN|nr:uncharacterized protein LOC112050903 isoform X1 [Bicyclus anynana]